MPSRSIYKTGRSVYLILDSNNIPVKVGRDASGWTGSGEKQLKKMMDMPALSEVDWTRNDRVRL